MATGWRDHYTLILVSKNTRDARHDIIDFAVSKLLHDFVWVQSQA